MPNNALCEQKAIVLHLPEGWNATTVESGSYYLTAPDSKAGIMGRMIEKDCELRDGWIKANYTDADGKRVWGKIPFSD